MSEVEGKRMAGLRALLHSPSGLFLLLLLGVLLLLPWLGPAHPGAAGDSQATGFFSPQTHSRLMEVSLLILIYIILSWVRLPYSIWLSRIQQFLRDVVEPYLGLFRRILPPLGAFDLSPIVAIFVLFLVERLIVGLLGRFH